MFNRFWTDEENAMLVYHGTTAENAKKIAQNGFSPKNGAVWFTTNREYALNRARGKSGKAQYRAVILTCELDLQGLRYRLGEDSIVCKEGIIAIKGRVPPSALRVLSTEVGMRRANTNRLAGFFGACCIETPSAKATTKSLYAAYKDWCPEHGQKALDQRVFEKYTKDCGFLKKSSKGRRYWLGISVAKNKTVKV